MHNTEIINSIESARRVASMHALCTHGVDVPDEFREAYDSQVAETREAWTAHMETWEPVAFVRDAADTTPIPSL